MLAVASTGGVALWDLAADIYAPMASFQCTLGWVRDLAYVPAIPVAGAATPPGWAAGALAALTDSGVLLVQPLEVAATIGGQFEMLGIVPFAVPGVSASALASRLRGGSVSFAPIAQLLLISCPSGYTYGLRLSADRAAVDRVWQLAGDRGAPDGFAWLPNETRAQRRYRRAMPVHGWVELPRLDRARDARAAWAAIDPLHAVATPPAVTGVLLCAPSVLTGQVVAFDIPFVGTVPAANTLAVAAPATAPAAGTTTAATTPDLDWAHAHIQVRASPSGTVVFFAGRDGAVAAGQLVPIHRAHRTGALRPPPAPVSSLARPVTVRAAPATPSPATVPGSSGSAAASSNTGSGPRAGRPAFPITFFETATNITRDSTFSSQDVALSNESLRRQLAVLDTRVVGTKSTELALQVTSPNATTAIAGFRIQLGGGGAPASLREIRIANRAVPVVYAAEGRGKGGRGARFRD